MTLKLEDTNQLRLSKNEDDIVIDVFKGIVTAMSIANGSNRAWWYTWLASRDRFNSTVLQKLTTVAVLGNQNTKTQISSDTLFEQFSRKIIPVKRLIGEMLWFLRWWYAENKKHDPGQADVIIITQLSRASFKNGLYNDIYFKNLPYFLKDQGEKVVVCGSIQGEPSLVVGARNKTLVDKDLAVTSFGAFLRLTDFIPALWGAVFNGIRCVDVSLPWSVEGTRKLLAEDIRHAIPHIYHGLMIERATARLFKYHPFARIIHIYENNPWEHAINLQASKGKRDTIGFLHCAVLPSHLKNFISIEEQSLRPSPDRIVCTGNAAREVFLGLGAHDPNRVFAGCDLRETRPKEQEPRVHTRVRVRNILAILEGLPSMVEFLKFLDEAAEKIPSIKFFVSEHPALPLSLLKDKAGIKLHPEGRLVQNLGLELLDEMKAADVVIYQGTTAAMTAVFLGIPVIKFRSKGHLEDDPLFQSHHLKRTASSIKQLQKVLDDLSTLSLKDYFLEQEAARGYVEEYLESATPNNMKAFLIQNKIDKTCLDDRK